MIYNVNIPKTGLIPPLGKGPFKGIDISDTIYDQLQLSGIPVIRNYKARDLYITSTRGHLVLLSGETKQLNAKFWDDDAQPVPTVKWESSNATAITVSDKGEIAFAESYKFPEGTPFVYAIIKATTTINGEDVTDSVLVEGVNGNSIPMPTTIKLTNPDTLAELDSDNLTLGNTTGYEVKVSLTPDWNSDITGEVAKMKNKMKLVDYVVSNPALVTVEEVADKEDTFKIVTNKNIGTLTVKFFSVFNPSLSKELIVTVGEKPRTVVNNPGTENFLGSAIVIGGNLKLAVDPEKIQTIENHNVSLDIKVLPEVPGLAKYFGKREINLLPTKDNRYIGKIVGNTFVPTDQGEAKLMIKQSYAIPHSLDDPTTLVDENDLTVEVPIEVKSYNGDTITDHGSVISKLLANNLKALEVKSVKVDEEKYQAHIEFTESTDGNTVFFYTEDNELIGAVSSANSTATDISFWLHPEYKNKRFYALYANKDGLVSPKSELFALTNYTKPAVKPTTPDSSASGGESSSASSAPASSASSANGVTAPAQPSVTPNSVATPANSASSASNGVTAPAQPSVTPNSVATPANSASNAGSTVAPSSPDSSSAEPSSNKPL